MNVSFSTTSKAQAEKYLALDQYKYLSDDCKKYVLENLGDIRVQDPMMYPSPQLEIIGDNAQQHYDEIMRLIDNGY